MSGRQRTWLRDLTGQVVVCALAAAVGCSGEDATGQLGVTPGQELLEDCRPEPDGPVEVTFWHGEEGERRDLLHRFVREFDRTDPTVTVEVVRIAGGRDGAMDRWREAGTSGRPSLVLLPQEVTRRVADSRQTVAPGPCLDEAVPDLLPVMEAAWTVDGTAQAVPFGVSTPVMLYNRELFAAGGLDPDDPPATLREVRQAASRLVAEGVVPTGLVFNTAPSSGGSWFVNQWSAQTGELALSPANGRRGRPSEVTAVWDRGALPDHLGWLQDMVTSGLAVSRGQDPGGEANLVPLFDAADQAAMAWFTSTATGELHDLVDRELGVAPLPGPGAGSLPGGTALWLSAGRPGPETRAAWRLAAFLASAEIQARWSTQGYVPIRPSALEEEPLAGAWAERPSLGVPYRVLESQGTGPAELGMSAGPQQRLDIILADAVDAAVEGGDPERLLARAAGDADHLLEVYGRGFEAGQDHLGRATRGVRQDPGRPGVP